MLDGLNKNIRVRTYGLLLLLLLLLRAALLLDTLTAMDPKVCRDKSEDIGSVAISKRRECHLSSLKHDELMTKDNADNACATLARPDY